MAEGRGREVLALFFIEDQDLCIGGTNRCDEEATVTELFEESLGKVSVKGPR